MENEDAAAKAFEIPSGGTSGLQIPTQGDLTWDTSLPKCHDAALPMIIECIQCDHKLRVPNSAAGKKARCPSCGVIMPIDAAGEAIAEVTAEPNPRRPLSSQKRAQRSERKSPESTARKTKRTGRDSAPSRKRPAQPQAASSLPAKRKRPPAEKSKRRRKRRPPENNPFDDLNSYGAAVDDYVEADHEYDPFRPAKRRKKRRPSPSSHRERGGLETTGTGLLVMAWSALLAPIAIPFAVALVAANQPPAGMTLYIGFLVVAGLAFLAGELICLFTVPDTTARVLLIISLFCQAGETWFNISRIHDPPGAPNMSRIVMRTLCGLAMGITMQLFLRRVAIMAKLDEIADQAKTVLVLLGVTLTAIVGSMLMAAANPGALFVMIIVGFATIIVLIVVAIKQYFILFRLGSQLRAGHYGQTWEVSAANRKRRFRTSSGGRYVQFSYTISLGIVTFTNYSEPIHIERDEGTFGKGLKYTIISLLFGWWGIPFGPIFTVVSVIENCTGGRELD